MQLKFAVSNPSLVQSAFTSHGSDRHGSGTIIIMGGYIDDIIQHQYYYILYLSK